MKDKKTILITSMIILLLLVVGVTYAFFTYESGTKSDIVTGQIYMNYEETNTISLTGVFPETKQQALSRQDENGVFEFTITGRNTSKYPVYYEIDLLEGGVITGKTEQSTKILPEHVMIYLEKDGVPVIEGEIYADFNNRRIYTETIPANQTSNIEHKYTLRMWIDENVTISDTDPNADYTTSEWNDAYTSLKVRVVGDFEYKEVATDASCFEYNVVPAEYDINYNYPVITLDTSEEKVDTCVAYLESLWGTEEEGKNVAVGETYEAICNGTGTNWGNTLREMIANGYYFDDEQIHSLGVVENVTYENRYYELNASEEAIDSCKKYMLNFYGGRDYSDDGDGYNSFCEGSGLLEGSGYGDEKYVTIFDLYSKLNDGKYDDIRFGLIERNVFVQLDELPQGIEITNYDETCGTEVVIPSMIEGLPVTRIASGMDNNAFVFKYITSVKFPNTLLYIGAAAFGFNLLTEVTIPDSVTYIGEQTFWSNNLTTVVLGRNVSYIGDDAFFVYGDNGSRGFPNLIEKIVNKSGKAFNWQKILDANGWATVQDPGVVATGTYVYYNNGERVIQITSE